MKNLSKKKFFDFGLYVEGLRKVRVVGIASAIICTVICALVPIVDILTGAGYGRKIVTAQLFAIPLLVIMPLAIIFVLSMFSYLNERNESDFYHSIPYTRLCVYFSFMAAILSWIWGIVTVTTLTTAFFWAIDVHASLVISCLYLVPLAYFIVTLFLVGIMTVAMMLTGTSLNNIAIGTLLLFFVRSVGVMVTYCLDSAVRIFDISYSIGAFLKINFFMPFALIDMHVTGNVTAFFENYAMFFYTLAVGILTVALGAFLYHIRRSEIAGQNAPNKVLHHVYRCMITLPFALILTTVCIVEGYSYGDVESSAFILLLVLTLLVNYLYELILTKSWKRTVKTTPYLSAVLAACLLFAGAIALTRSVILKDLPESEDVAAVRLYDSDDYDRSFESWRTTRVTSSNVESIDIVTDALRYSADLAEKGEYDWSRQEQKVEITLKSGRKIGRVILVDADEINKLNESILEEPAYAAAYLPLPSGSEVNSVRIYGGETYYYDDSEYAERCMEVWRTFVKEYETLTTEQKYAVKSWYWSGGEKSSMYFCVSGTYRGNQFVSYYYLIDELTETIDKYAEVFTDEKEIDVLRLTVDDTLEMIGKYEGNGPVPDVGMSVSSLRKQWSTSGYQKSFFVYAPGDTERFKVLLECLRQDLDRQDSPDCSHYVRIEIWNGKDGTIPTLVKLSDETYALFDAFGY